MAELKQRDVQKLAINRLLNFVQSNRFQQTNEFELINRMELLNESYEKYQDEHAKIIEITLPADLPTQDDALAVVQEMVLDVRTVIQMRIAHLQNEEAERKRAEREEKERAERAEQERIERAEREENERIERERAERAAAAQNQIQQVQNVAQNLANNNNKRNGIFWIPSHWINS